MNVLPTVWAVGALLIVLLCGVVARLTGLIPISAIGPYNKLIFTFGIPCLAFNAMATHSVQTLDWTFVLIFVFVRATAALAAAIFTVVRHGDFGDFAVHYLAPTWIDVITFGIPIISVMFSPAIGAHYPVLAAFSSFIFELPLVLICLEISRLRKARRLQKQKQEQQQPQQQEALSETNESGEQAAPLKKELEHHASTSPQTEPLLAGSGGEEKEEKKIGSGVVAEENGAVEEEFVSEETRGQQARRIAIFVGKRLLQTPPLIAIVLGLIYGSIQIPVPDILAKVISYLGGLVTPIASFSVGMFVCDGKPFKRVWRKTIVYMLLKIFAMPLLAMLIVYISGIRNPAAEVAVIIASLPLAFPAFTITKQYGLGEDVMSTCITAGTILMLPTVLFWWWFVETIDIFPNAPSPSPSPPVFNSTSFSSSSFF